MSATPLDPSLVEGDAAEGELDDAAALDDGAIENALHDGALQLDFSDELSDVFTVKQGSWSINGGAYHATPAGDAISLLNEDAQPDGDFVVSVTASADEAVGSLFSNAFIIFDYQSPTNFKFAGLYTSTDLWVIGQRTSKGWTTQAEFSAPVDAGTSYDMTLVIQNDTHATLCIGGVAKVGCSFADSLTDGDLGLGTRNAVSHFDDLTIRPLIVAGDTSPGELPVSDDFDDLLAEHFAPELGQWSITLGQYVVTPDPDADGVSLLSLSDGLPDDLRLSVTFNSDDIPGERFSNGFVIFDYQSPTDFKFAGGFATRDEWAIGHRTVDGWVTDVVITAAIDPFTDYTLNVEIHEGSRVTLSVGELTVEHVYSESVTDGEIGLGSYNSVVRFDDFTAVDLTPQPTVSVKVHGDKLLITSEGPSDVSIVALGDNTIQVLQHGQVLATHTLRTGHLRVLFGGSDDHLTLDLGGLTALRHVTVDLGHGDNSLLFTNGEIHGHLKVLGGKGNDAVDIAADAVVARHAWMKLAGGDNQLSVSGEIHRSLWFKGGSGDDTLTVDGTVNRHLFAHLGRGDNHSEVSPDADVGHFVLFGAGKGTGYPSHESRDDWHDKHKHKEKHHSHGSRSDHQAQC
jgi:hypothetical protein